MTTHNTTVILSVAITATISVLIAGILFYFFYRFVVSRRLKKSRPDPIFRRETATAGPHVEFRQQGGAVRGIIVDQQGLDVLYLRTLEEGHFTKCFSKVWHNPTPTVSEEVKRMNNSRGNNKPSISESIQEIPLLKETNTSYENSSLPPPLPQISRIPLPSMPPSPPPPPPPVKTKGLISTPIPPRAINNSSKMEASLVETLKENEAVQMKLKPLHWEKVTANANHSMVWNDISDGSFRFDDELMETLFGYTATTHKSIDKTNKSSAQERPNSVSTAPIFLLDPRKSQNSAIVLKSIPISRKQILESLSEGRGLNTETLEKLTKICPTQDEITKILKFNGNPTKLADAESFHYHMLKSVPSAYLRFNAMLFKSNYDTDIFNFKETLQILELGCEELRSGGIFFKLLEAILKAGNRMNAGTARGNAQGFYLNALRKLSDVKSTDGKTTLLYFVVKQVIRYEGKRCLVNQNLNSDATKFDQEKDGEYLKLGLPVLQGLSNDFVNVKKSADIDYNSFISMCSVITTRVEETKQVLTLCGDKGIGFLREMKGFLEECEEELSVVREEETRVMELVKRTTLYYQGVISKDKGMNPLQLFVIVKDFLNMVDQVCSEITKKAEKVNFASGGDEPPLLSSPVAPKSPMRWQDIQFYLRAQRARISSSDSEDDL